MKAIKITKEIKNLNPKFGGEVNSIYSGAVPKKFVRNEGTVLGYNNSIALQDIDGWKEVVNPIIGENQRRGKLIETTEGFTYEVIDLTTEEIEANSLIRMPKSDFKLALLSTHGITNSNIDALFSSLTDQNQIEVLKIMWYETAMFSNDTPELFSFAPAMGLVAEDIENIFKNYNN